MNPSPSPAPILISVGTRPEIIKMAPLHAELRRRGLPVAWVHTGQHREMAQPLYEFFGIEPEHEVTLERRSGELSHLNALLLEGALLETGPDRHLNRGLRQDGAP